ncbi:aminotransferase class I/II-fold pyridoxal phosphate-dependent enzyme [Amphibiibacter pelophylacis]|uniref:8-amino-7-oxononanoate synthase n=1 Tax=Amphibiibacter pelophylacis TaxID=1799477 RepID=A0ACC6NYS9_9BURK
MRSALPPEPDTLLNEATDPRLVAWHARWQTGLAAQDAQGLRRRRRLQGGQILFCSNDYLGLAQHPRLAQAASDAAQRHGVGSGASHLISGHHACHDALEEALADWFAPHIPQVRALYVSTGFMANLGALGALASEDSAFFCDRLNHASLIDGARLARASQRCTVLRYPHADLAALDRQLAASPARWKWIVTDGVFSMDGDCADLIGLLRLCDQHDAWLIVDDAHGVGVLGAQEGQGCLAQQGVRSERLVLVGTLGKALGVGGAFVVAPPLVIEHLIQHARPYIYTTATPPLLSHATLAALQIVRSPEGLERRQRVLDHVARFVAAMAGLLPPEGLVLPAGHAPGLIPSHTPIQAWLVGDNATALRLAQRLDDQGLRVGAIRPPTVPPGTARLRITFSAAHSAEQVDALAGALRDALRDEGWREPDVLAPGCG